MSTQLFVDYTNCSVPENFHTYTQGAQVLVENTRRREHSEANIFKEKYKAKLELWQWGVQNYLKKTFHGRGPGYFLE